jgi:peptidoglycan/xylan/chitin deacetylase (PgdA/CDA1 family)
MSERLKALSDAGVSIWLDDLSRERIETGNLADLVKNSHVVGVTTNPSIFAAALADGERYDAQVRELAASGRVTTLDAALTRLADPTATGEDPVVGTFDDGPADFVDTTLPILAAHGVPATMYLATAFVEEQRPFPYGAPPLSWAGLRDSATTGLLTVGSHTHTHALLDRLAPEDVAAELDTSVRLIEDRLGSTPVHFAYPKSVPPTSAADAAVRTRFRSAALAGTRPNPFGRTDPFRLARSPIQAGDGMRWFRAKADGGLRFEDDVRRAVNRLRYAGAES